MKYFIAKNSLALSLLLFALRVFAGGDAQAGAARGAAICASCHGEKWVAVNPRWPKLAGQGEKYLLKQLRDYRNGKRDDSIMKVQTAMLEEAEMADIAAYFAAQKPFASMRKEEQSAQDEPGESLYRHGDVAAGLVACASCHGADGAGNEDSASPRLAGQHRAYIVEQLHKFANAAREGEKQAPDERRDNDAGGVMREVAKRLSDAQIKALAAYLKGKR